MCDINNHIETSISKILRRVISSVVHGSITADFGDILITAVIYVSIHEKTKPSWMVE